MQKNLVRLAKHAGSWYTDDPASLNQELDGYLAQAQVTIPSQGKFKALIGPHAGLAYSGPCAAWAYKNLAQKVGEFERVVLLGPSHKVYLDWIGTTACKEWQTPLGNIKVDEEAVNQLVQASEASTGDIQINPIRKDVEENEHSLEMHISYIQKVFRDGGRAETMKLVPLMVGDIPESKYAAYAEVLLPLFLDDKTVFVVSSDFCHWGQRFRFTHKFDDEPLIHNSIERLDRQGMQLIEAQNFGEFTRYLDSTGNTICGRHPIQLLLAIIELVKQKRAQ